MGGQKPGQVMCVGDRAEGKGGLDPIIFKGLERKNSEERARN